jgi:hypothetical protein
MTKEPLTVRFYEKGDEVGITRLFQEIFGREMTLGEWSWKYRESYPQKIYSSVAIDKGRGIVGHYGALRLPLIYHGNVKGGLAICDVMIHPKFRGIKVLRKLSSLAPAEAVKDGIIIGYGFPNKRNLLSPALSLGIYEMVEDVMEGTKEVRFHNDPLRYGFKLFPLEYSDARIDRLWESCKGDLALAVVRDRRYLTWRYKDHPLFHYELWGLRRRMGRKLLGLAILRKEEERVLLIDFLCSKGMLGPLLKKLENYTYTTGGKTLTLWFPPFMERPFSALGFSTGTTYTSVPRTTHENTLTKAEIEGNFFYTMGDTDLF